MTITMTNTRIPTIQEIGQLLTSTEVFTFTATNRAESYQWIEDTLRHSRYLKLKKRERGLVREYLQKMTGYSRTQIAELIYRFKTTTRVRMKDYARRRFEHTYQTTDIALLAEVDLAHGQLSGPATKKILQRAYGLFNKKEFVRLAKISVSHLYNLRHTFGYREKTKLFQKTRPTTVPIGQRQKPRPEGRPGFIRVDSVHQGDSPTGVKGVYHINLVDEVLQWELVICVEKISERFLVPALELALQQFPFVVLNFHADNGSEYINYQVAALLNRLVVKLTKSRPRKSNDNALVEAKNGSVIRKHLGYRHIPQRHAGKINEWYQQYFNVYLNFHRPCGYGKEVVINAQTGKRKRVYPHENYQTPYDKLKSLNNPQLYLHPRITFAALDRIAYAVSDTDFAIQMNAAKKRLFSTFHS